MKNCVLYCRKSSEDSARQVQSIEDQKRVMLELALNHSLVVKRVFEDEKSAGKPYQRKGYSEMMELVRKGKIDTILTWKIDRLSRNAIDNGEISWLLQQGAIKQIITPDRIYRPEDNVLLFYVEGAMANQYLRDLSKNVKRGMQGKVERGLYPACAPIGYLNSGLRKGEKYIDIDPIMFPRLKALWGLLIRRRFQLSDLYRLMKKQYPIYGKNGTIVSFSTFHRIFQNPFYSGLFRWGGKLHVGTHQKMVTKTEFEQIQDFLIRKPKTRVANHEFTYRGVLSCGCCGSAITAENKRKFIKTDGVTKCFEYYKCPHHKKGVVCSSKPMSKALIDKEVKRALEAIYLPDEVIEYGIQIFGSETKQIMDVSKQVKSFQRQIVDVKRKIATVTNNLVLESDADCRQLMKDKLLEFKIDLQRLIEDLDSCKEKAKSFHLEMRSQLTTILNAKQIIKKGLREDKLKLLEALGENWTVKNKKLSFSPNLLCLAIQKYKKDSRKQKKFGLRRASNRNEKLTLEQLNFVWRGICELIRNSFGKS